LIAALIGAGPAAAGDSDLASALRAGGFVIVLRHGATAAAQGDNNDMLHPNNVAVERQLNHEGRALAATFGNALRQLDVPVGKVYTSQLNRAYETAVLAGFKDIEKTEDITEGGLDVSPGENARRAEALRVMIEMPPRPGTNTILVTHKPNIVEALGKDWSDVKEGEAAIFHPENGTTKLVARVQMDEWPHLTAAK
jgi:broad specificity phosphatase PhoE